METDSPDIEILLVEDDPDDAELTVYALMKANNSARLLRMKDGATTLNYLLGQDPDHQLPPTLHFVLLDLKLPKVDGLEVLRKIREDEKTRALPVVVLTSSAQKRDISEAYDLGINSYVVKPVDFESFVEKIGSIVFYWSQVNEKPRPRSQLPWAKLH